MPTATALPEVRPPLKWAGGKRWQVPFVEPIWRAAACKRLVEPFCGGLAIGLGVRPPLLLANDANEHLINFYSQLKKGLRVSIPMENDAELYYEHRESFNTLIKAGRTQTKRAASLFYYLNRTGFNGLCRFNRQGLFNVPFGRYRKINYTRDFSPYEEVFADFDFQCGSFDELNLANDDFVYADPPYDVEFTSYSAGGFSWDDQVRAAEWLAGHAGPVVLVNQATRRIDRLYRDLGFSVRYLEAPRRISNTGDRTPAKEILATLNC